MWWSEKCLLTLQQRNITLHIMSNFPILHPENEGGMNERIKRLRQPVVADLCDKHGVKHLYVFGSVLTPRFSDESDVDLLVEFKTDEIADYLTNYFELKYALQDAVGREEDLVEDRSIRNPVFRRSVDRTKQKIYG